MGRRSTVRTADLRVVQRASSLIAELGQELDARLQGEQRTEERLRLLRETTNRITRTANDAVLAYQRASRSLTAALGRPNADAAALAVMRSHLDTARAQVLGALDVASRRYPTAAPSAELAEPGVAGSEGPP